MEQYVYCHWCDVRTRSDMKCFNCGKEQPQKDTNQLELQLELHPEVEEYEDPLDKDVREREEYEKCWPNTPPRSAS